MALNWTVETDLQLFQLANRLDFARDENAVGVHRDCGAALSQELHDLGHVRMCQRLAAVEVDNSGAELDEFAEGLENLIAPHFVGHRSMAVTVGALEVTEP